MHKGKHDREQILRQLKEINDSDSSVQVTGAVDKNVSKILTLLIESNVALDASNSRLAKANFFLGTLVFIATLFQIWMQVKQMFWR
jgi:VanZ family protein